MELPPGLQHTIAQTQLFTDARLYTILSLPLTQMGEALRLLMQLDEPFAALVRDKDEVTLVLPRITWDEVRPALEATAESGDYRLITFDLPLDLGLIGYLATLTSVVAAHGVSVFPVSSFARDHIFVPADDFERAWEALRALIRHCRAQEQNATA